MDYHCTFSIVVKPITIRLILSLPVHHNWYLHQLDIDKLFHQGLLEKDVYMNQPCRYSHPYFPHYFCKLKKTIYGLKQALEPGTLS